MKNKLRKRRLYTRLFMVLANPFVDHLNNRLAKFNPGLHGGEILGKSKPVGREFGAHSEYDVAAVPSKI